MSFHFYHGKRYRTFNTYLKETFGCRVHKVSLDAGFTCPNRDGTCGTGGCIYCSNKGFSYNTRKGVPPLTEQLKQGIDYMHRRFHASKFIAYFQAYSSTYAPLNHLKKTYDTIRSFPEIVGLFISTRPDCLSEAVLDLIETYREDYLIWIELGLQSASDDTLRRINRGHTVADFIDAATRAARHELPVCAHVILGLPWETKREILKTAELLTRLRAPGVKIHALHILKNTRLASEYAARPFALLEMQQYAALVCDFLERVPPEAVVLRLAVDVPENKLVEPQWCLRKQETMVAIEAELERRNSFQGRLSRDTS